MVEGDLSDWFVLRKKAASLGKPAAREPGLGVSGERGDRGSLFKRCSLADDAICVDFQRSWTLHLEAFRHVSAALGQLRHNLFVQPNIPVRRTIESAGVTKLARQFFAFTETAIQF